jgi:hypothetical protein
MIHLKEGRKKPALGDQSRLELATFNPKAGFEAVKRYGADYGSIKRFAQMPRAS